ncbi:hypothetical protein, variant [Blastomyces gilchristii SLH14081]|nr:hypothetical protein, variant [Blastomyces gilchristii SLH14081]OAT08754.1 hypothetical protein, variant [Blastomyces gilchristii SLH14081]
MAQKIPEEAHDRMLSKTLDPTGQLMRIENSNLSDTMAFSLVTVRRSSQTPTGQQSKGQRQEVHKSNRPGPVASASAIERTGRYIRIVYVNLVMYCIVP